MNSNGHLSPTLAATPPRQASTGPHLPIAVTMGDPAGIGPELVVKVLARNDNRSSPSNQVTTYGHDDLPTPTYVVYGDAGVLAREARRMGLNLDRLAIQTCSTLPPDFPQGRVDARAGDAAYRAVRMAAEDAIAGKVRAVVTAPLNKEAMNAAGHQYPGHTEILAEVAGGVPVRMMLANDELRTVLVTIHQPLRQAIDSLSTALIIQTIVLTNRHLLAVGIRAPRIAVAGLNPHAGEGGLIGREEIDIIGPAIAQSRQQGIDASGPHAPDTVFMRARGFGEFDVVIAMYHDQGLIPVKYLGLDQGVNVTVGLPFVRTSPDHGTAFDIAGLGRADTRSFESALRMADLTSRGPRPLVRPGGNCEETL